MLGVTAGCLRGGSDQPSHPCQRIFRGLVAVGGREVGRSLDVGDVVRASRGGADQPHPQTGQHVEHLVGLGQVDARSRAVTSERQRVGAGGLGNPDAAAARGVGDEVEQRKAHGHAQAWEPSRGFRR